MRISHVQVWTKLTRILKKNYNQLNAKIAAKSTKL